MDSKEFVVNVISYTIHVYLFTVNETKNKQKIVVEHFI